MIDFILPFPQFTAHCHVKLCLIVLLVLLTFHTILNHSLKPFETSNQGLGGGREVQEAGDICILTADSHCYTTEINTTM